MQKGLFANLPVCCLVCYLLCEEGNFSAKEGLPRLKLAAAVATVAKRCRLVFD